MNNKGFAISTMLYGLSIIGLMLAILMVQTMSTSRFEQRRLIDSIEQELSDFGILSEYYSWNENPNPDTTDKGVRTFKLPITGWYKIELWSSAKFVNLKDEDETISETFSDKIRRISNAGSYTSQTLYLQEGTTLFFFLGSNLDDNAQETAAADNINRRETTVCNKNSKCNCSTQSNCIASSEYYFNYNNKTTFVDPYDSDIKNNLKLVGNQKTATLYKGNKINMDERGQAQITLVSTSKNYSPISCPIYTSGAVRKEQSGTFYIIDAKNGSALTFDKVPVKDNGSIDYDHIQDSVKFENFEGKDTQKWKYNPQEHSLVNVRNGYSLETIAPIDNLKWVGAMNPYSNRTFEKWNLLSTAISPQTNNAVITNGTQLPITMKSGSNTYYLYHNRKPLYSEEVEDEYEADESRIQLSSKITADDKASRNYSFYFINAY